MGLFLSQIQKISKRQTLGKEERLKSRKIIELLFKEGKSVAVHPVRITYKIVFTDPGNFADSAVPDVLMSLQAAFSASSRNFKKAVDRNRIKRLLRESYRRQKGGFKTQLSAKFISVSETTTGRPANPVATENKLPGLAMFIIYTGKELPAYDFVDDKMKQALQKLVDQIR